MRTVCDDEAAEHEAVCNVDEADDVAQDHRSADCRQCSEDGHGRLIDQEHERKIQEEPA